MTQFNLPLSTAKEMPWEATPSFNSSEFFKILIRSFCTHFFNPTEPSTNPTTSFASASGANT